LKELTDLPEAGRLKRAAGFPAVGLVARPGLACSGQAAAAVARASFPGSSGGRPGGRVPAALLFGGPRVVWANRAGTARSGGRGPRPDLQLVLRYLGALWLVSRTSASTRRCKGCARPRGLLGDGEVLSGAAFDARWSPLCFSRRAGPTSSGFAAGPAGRRGGSPTPRGERRRARA